MKKISFFALMLMSVVLVGAGCSGNQPLTEQEQADALGITIEEYRETKEAAARMNMGVDEHMNMDME
jgi:ABC-type glycerol-3-phosphate transport system substrate-binding protein